jgi:hypothetical protein
MYKMDFLIQIIVPLKIFQTVWKLVLVLVRIKATHIEWYILEKKY